MEELLGTRYQGSGKHNTLYGSAIYLGEFAYITAKSAKKESDPEVRKVMYIMALAAIEEGKDLAKIITAIRKPNSDKILKSINKKLFDYKKNYDQVNNYD